MSRHIGLIRSLIKASGSQQAARQYRVEKPALANRKAQDSGHGPTQERRAEATAFFDDAFNFGLSCGGRSHVRRHVFLVFGLDEIF
jgi:hypothetical protein